MKKTRIHRVWILFLLSIMACLRVRAQYMPVVFDKRYGDENQIQLICPSTGDETAMAGKEGQEYNLTWVGREDEVLFSLSLAGFTAINELTELEDNHTLLVGQSVVMNTKSRKDNVTLSGRAVILDRNGHIVTNIYAGGQGSELLKGALLRSGSLILSGMEPKRGSGRQGILLRVDKSGRVIYQYKNTGSGYCDQFEVLGNATEYICAAFSGDREKEQTVVVRLGDKGKSYYVTAVPTKRFIVIDLNTNINDGPVIVTGNSLTDGSIIYKIRLEGDVVFIKTLIPANQGSAMLNHLRAARNGNILVGGSGNKGYYALLRSDGTALYSGTSNGSVRGVGMNRTTGESVVTTYDVNARRGASVRILSTGRTEFDWTIDGNFDKIKVTNSSEVLLLSSDEGWVYMYSVTGERESDRYMTDNKPTIYRQALTTSSGKPLFLGSGSRPVKFGYGLYVSDVKITKPTNGTAAAMFTVTLTRYATTKKEAPVPVSVGYATREASATTASNFTPVKGKLSLTSSRGTADRYLVKQDIEVPVKANDLIEGVKGFELLLSDVQQGYLAKPIGKAVIEDRQAVIKLVRTERGEEGSKDILYELGLFKIDGTPLTNATGANIIVDGIYGEDTADALDFDMGLTPRVIFANGSQKPSFNVRTLEDIRYEPPKTVVVNFNKVHSLSGSDVVFDGELLSCSGVVADQPARLAITLLGDHRVNNNVVLGFFIVSLLRASDGTLLTNATGSDIIINCVTLSDATAKEGKDFVFTNPHDLRISGGDNHSSANVNGVVLFSTDALEKQVRLRIKSANQPTGAQSISVSDAEHMAESTIRK